MTETIIKIQVNGKAYELTEKPGEMLSDLLRYRFEINRNKSRMR